jgi:hypothetical protein
MTFPGRVPTARLSRSEATSRLRRRCPGKHCRRQLGSCLFLRDGSQLGTGSDRVRLDARSDKDGNRISQRRVAPCHPRGCVDTEAPEPKATPPCLGSRTESVRGDHRCANPLLDDPHDDPSPAGDPEGGFNIEYKRQVVIRRGHDLILPSLVLTDNDHLLAKEVAVASGPAVAQARSAAGCSVNDRESP